MNFIQSSITHLRKYLMLCVSLVKTTVRQYKINRQEKKDILFLAKQNDWYYQNSWFSSYFCQKLKRKTMNIIYKLYTTIEEYLLEKYLVEFYFYTQPSSNLDAFNKKHRTMYQGDFKCYLPILFMVKNAHELEALVGIINTQLVKEYGCTIIKSEISKKIISQEMFDTHIYNSVSKLKHYDNGTINIISFTPQLTDETFENKFLRKKDNYKFQILKSGPNLLKFNFEYDIKFQKLTDEE